MKQPSDKNSRSTLHEVARKAGVSVTTASLVLGGKADQHRISEETLLRVKQAAADLDYVPNLLVRSLQRGRTHIISFFSAFRNRYSFDIYMDRLSTATEMAAGRHGYNVLVYCDFALSTEGAYRFLNGGHSDGLLIFAPLPDDPLLPYLRQSRQPTVLINARDEAGKLPSVRDDVASGMRQVAQAFVDLGHRRIAAVVEDWPGIRDAAERAHLLQASLRELGADLPEQRIHNLKGPARDLLCKMMNEPEPPTALFCWRDRMAYWFLEACEELGIEVPGQLSIVGYDGLHWPAATRHVAASVQVDMDTLMEAAVNLLDRYIHGNGGEVIEQSLPVTLSFGTTLGPAYRF